MFEDTVITIPFCGFSLYVPFVVCSNGEIIVVPSYRDSSLPCLTNPSGAFTSSIR